MSTWTVFSNHGHVLLFLARFPESRLRDVAEKVGITERAVQKIVKDLQDSKVISVHKHGRRNRYRINGRKPLQHELEAHKTVGNLVRFIDKKAKSKQASQSAGLKSPVNARPEDPKDTISPAVSPVRSTGWAEPEPPEFVDNPAYIEPYLEPDTDLVPVSAYDPFEESPGYEAEPPADEDEAFQATAAATDSQTGAAVNRAGEAEPKKQESSPSADKRDKPARKGKPADDQQGSLF